MALTKAFIEILDAEAVDPDRGLEKRIPVQFNPSEYTLTKGVQLAEIAIPGLDSPILQFVRGQSEQLSLELVFDTTEHGMGEAAKDVRTLTRGLHQLVKVQPKTHAPPRVRVEWGQGLAFQGVVESVQQKLSLFNPLGVPLRATLSLTLREYRSLERQLEDLDLQSADRSRRHLVRRGDTLGRIAGELYGDPGAWRRLADANPGVDPRRPVPGTSLVVPPLAAGGSR